MKRFFTELMEVLSAVLLSSFIIYSVFTKIIGTPKDIKSIELNVTTTKDKVDTVLITQDSINNRINQIENLQIDFSQRLFENNYLIKQNNEQLEKLGKLINSVKKFHE
jgi:hypothetical protein